MWGHVIWGGVGIVPVEDMEPALMGFPSAAAVEQAGPRIESLSFKTINTISFHPDQEPCGEHRVNSSCARVHMYSEVDLCRKVVLLQHTTNSQQSHSIL